jgi:acetylglutamate kinase
MSIATKNWVVVKLGGSSLQDDGVVNSVAEDVKKLFDLGYKLILIHGGGPAINAALTEKNIQWEFIDGQRKTTAEMMLVIESTLVGTVNRRLQKTLSQHKIPVLGLAGSDLNILECAPLNPQLGRVGEVKKVNAALIEKLLEAEKGRLIPLVAPIGVDSAGERYNINADMAASHIASALGAQNLVFMTDQTGIWDAKKQNILQIDALALYQLIETKVVQGGMLVKVQAVLKALREKVNEVDIIDARRPGNLYSLVHENKSAGTRCFRN